MTRPRPKPLAYARPRVVPPRWPDASRGFATLRGNLAVVSALDVVQLLCNGAQSWVIRFLLRGNEASLTVLEGQLVDARWGTKSGEPAVIEIIACQEGFFQLEPVPQRVKPTIHSDWRVTLFSAVQALDERSRAAHEWPRPQPASKEPLLDADAEGAVDPIGEPSPESEPMPRRDSRVVPARSTEFDGPATGDDDPISATRERHHPAPHAAGSPMLPPARFGAAAYLIDLGFAALRTGNLGEAQRHWARALLCDPTNRTLQANLRKLEAKTHTEE